jgi:hypothetical protein
MINPNQLSLSLDTILAYYHQSFLTKTFGEESVEEDELMRIFGLTQTLKSENKQYWGRELGMCWQRLVTQLCEHTCTNFSGPLRNGTEELCDLVVGRDAIDTKYRIGSGDSGTLKKFKGYGNSLTQQGYLPILLILRSDNLPAAITACKSGGWTVLAGEETYQYLQNLTGFDLKTWLQSRKNHYSFQSLSQGTPTHL